VKVCSGNAILLSPVLRVIGKSRRHYAQNVGVVLAMPTSARQELDRSYARLARNRWPPSGNAVFRPANFTLLIRKVSTHRLGHALCMHVNGNAWRPVRSNYQLAHFPFGFLYPGPPREPHPLPPLP
jgi:hypothetical protein